MTKIPLDDMMQWALETAKAYRPLENSSPEVRQAYADGVHAMASMNVFIAAKLEEHAATTTGLHQALASAFSQMVREMADNAHILIPKGYE